MAEVAMTRSEQQLCKGGAPAEIKKSLNEQGGRGTQGRGLQERALWRALVYLGRHLNGPKLLGGGGKGWRR
jgi:hypothetical protein